MDGPTTLYTDNVGVIRGSEALTDGASKYYQAKLFQVKARTDAGSIKPTYMPSQENHADPFTKHTAAFQMENFMQRFFKQVIRS